MLGQEDVPVPQTAIVDTYLRTHVHAPTHAYAHSLSVLCMCCTSTSCIAATNTQSISAVSKAEHRKVLMGTVLQGRGEGRGGDTTH